MTSDLRASTCGYGAAKLLRLVYSLQNQVKDIKRGGDAEFIHQGRVISRRIRATLPVFGFCFDKKECKRWRSEIKKLTQSLGQARDTDVQILFLEKTLSETNIETRLGVDHLYQSQLKKRAAMQRDVLTTVKTITKSGVLNSMRVKLLETFEREKQAEYNVDVLRAIAEENVCTRLSDLLALEHYVDVEDAVEKHHQIRIAAKRLRYTMEIFQDAYGDAIKTMIDGVKGFQDQLGEIHDADLWMGYIPSFIVDECNLLSKDRRDEVINGLNQLLSQIREKRHQLYAMFVSDWATKRNEGFFEAIGDLASLKEDETKKPVRRRLIYAVKLIEEKYDPDPSHSKQVTKIALSLFDQLTSLHRLGEPERELLEYASMLHDIGWYRGGEGHNISSREMILAEGELPFGIRKRRIIANIARYHNKGTPGPKDREYVLLYPNDARIVDGLSAILRVADSLDASHGALVEHVEVVDDGKAIKLVCKVSKDTKMEENALRKKRKLFQNIFSKKLRIEWMAA